jgi:hypothetical protein
VAIGRKLFWLVFLCAACDNLVLRRPASPAAADEGLAQKAATPAPPRPPRPAAKAAASDGAEAQQFDAIRRGLRRLVAAEQTFYAENGVYTEDLSQLGYRPEGDTEVRFLWLSRDGWAASGTHPSMSGKDCVIFVGRAYGAPTTLKYTRSAREGVPVCDAPQPAARRTATAPAEAPPRPADTASALEDVEPFIQMKVDMRNLVYSQDTYLGLQGVYSRRTEPFALQYLWHRGVTIKVLSANEDSWSAVATHQRKPGKSCVIWYGPVPARPATEQQKKVPARAAVPVCDE